MKSYIPHFITLLNLFSGCVAVIFALEGNMKLTALFVCLGIFFDFFDGLLARKLNVASELGVQLDSLADMVTSGLVPGLVLFHLLGLAPQLSWETYNLLPYFGLLVTLASAFRLAKFNISTNQSDAFIGLPTPANALLIISLPLILEYQHSDAINVIILNPWFLIALTLVSCYLLNAPIKLIALKFKTWNFKDNASRYILIILSLVLLAIFQFAGIPLVIIAYILLSIASK
ncbi:CDP-diacylglycerol--serine O-phosphatidyltransferase [Formosa sp. Hel1_33_131]|uniref:CDP-diacylglycerol--serine O-phosphatidyltransferase n=1 Tax=Formosa sp. Hel1_33_131 TaxID=1336794 RepID=UPI00084E332B|nr:CDP-diacylglycerol--serine O-phosphatidyltransferase [Formosa sp. Hel1_33_131]